MKQEHRVAQRLWEEERKVCGEALRTTAGWNVRDVERVLGQGEKRLRTAWLAAREREISGLVPVLTLAATVLIAVAASVGGLPKPTSTNLAAETLPGVLIALAASLSVTVVVAYVSSNEIAPALRRSAVIEECVRIMADGPRPATPPLEVGAPGCRKRRIWPRRSVSVGTRDNGADPRAEEPR